MLLGVFVFLRPRRWPTKGDWKFLVLCGVLWFGVYNLALNEAEQRLDAGTTAMLVNIGPLLIALLAGVLLHEGFPRQLVFGSIAAFGGVILIGLSSSEDGPRRGAPYSPSSPRPRMRSASSRRSRCLPGCPRWR